MRYGHQQHLPIMRPIALEELVSAIRSFIYHKTAGIDNIYPEFVKLFRAKVQK